MKNKKILKNTSMLLILNVVKLFFPFITLPYLTRVLSTDSYGVVAYVKAVMSYMQVIIDFGFILSATKMVVESKEDKDKLNRIVSVNMFAKIILAVIAFFALLILICSVPVLRRNALFTLLSYLVVVLTIFLMDFLFRGIEQMQVITIRFVVMKGLATICTFVFVKSDADLLLIPILDLVGSIIAVLLVVYELKKMKIEICRCEIKECINIIKDSSVYFLSNVASTSFNVFNTIVAGLVLSATDIAFWSVCMQIVNAIQALYTPVSDAIYPEMIEKKDRRLIGKIIKVFMPIVFIGCIVCFFFGDFGLFVIGGLKYVPAFPALRALIPVLFFGFLAIVFGWPSLGAIGRVKETTFSTVVASLFQIIVVIILALCGKLTLLNMAISRSITEIIMFTIRLYFFVRFKDEFNIPIDARRNYV